VAVERISRVTRELRTPREAMARARRDDIDAAWTAFPERRILAFTLSWQPQICT